MLVGRGGGTDEQKVITQMHDTTHKPAVKSPRQFAPSAERRTKAPAASKNRRKDGENEQNGFYGASTIKRRRRTKKEMQKLRKIITDILVMDNPMGLRQLFYRLTVEKAIEKKETEYKAVGRILVQMRRGNVIPYSWISDNTRWMRKPRTFSSMEDALENCVRSYRRALWDNQDCYVEIWTEKDALAGVLLEETRKWDVPLMVSRGFSSETYLYEAAQVIKSQNKPAYLYYFGDHDPSGVVIDKVIERQLRRCAPNAEIHFQRVAVTVAQISQLHLPTRPTKKKTGLGKKFKGDSVEVDAIPAATLRAMVRDCIERHVDKNAYDITRKAEQSEREILTCLTDSIRKEPHD
jgi:hypothetical protein